MIQLVEFMRRWKYRTYVFFLLSRAFFSRRKIHLNNKHQAMLEQANADVVATRSVMDTLTDKTKEYLQTSDNCLTSLAVASCCACLIMIVVVFFLYG
jgi:hypothetical protein